MRRALMVLCQIAGLLWMPLTAGAWLDNKPTNYNTVLTDYTFDAQIPTTASDQPMGDGSGWYVYYPTSRRTTTRIADFTGEISPQHVMETRYEVGDLHGIGKVKLYRSVPSSIKEFYIAMRVKWDSDYEWHPISNKLFYLEPGNIILQSRHVSNSIQRYNSVYIGGTGGTDHMPDNNIPITLGEWHTIEYIIKRGTTNGELHVWLDGVKTMTKTGINVPPTTSTQTLDLNDTWGGDGAPRTRQSWRWMDHLYIAVPGDGNTSPPATPVGLRIITSP